MRRWAAFLLRLYVTAACVCLLAPILIVVILAFSGEGYLRFPPSSLSRQADIRRVTGASRCRRISRRW
jgi:ABC-type spermidine/putrescine transport system permease subunit II